MSSDDNVYEGCINEIRVALKEINDFLKISKPYMPKIKSDSTQELDHINVRAKYRDFSESRVALIRDTYPNLILNIMKYNGYIDALDEIIKNINLHVNENIDKGYLELLTRYSELNALTNNNEKIKSIFGLSEDQIKTNLELLLRGKDKNKFVEKLEKYKKSLRLFCDFVKEKFLTKSQREELTSQLEKFQKKPGLYQQSNTGESERVNSPKILQKDDVDTDQDTVQIEELNEHEINKNYETIKRLISLSNDLCKRYLKSASPGEKAFSQNPIQFISFYSVIDNVVSNPESVDNVMNEFDHIIHIFEVLIQNLLPIRENSRKKGRLLSENVDEKFREEIEYILNSSKKEGIESLETFSELFHSIPPESMKKICLKFKANFDLDRLISYLSNSVRVLTEYKNMFNVRR